MEGLFNRSERLLGSDTMSALKQLKVIVFGVGGVGSWCAECLVRNGIENLTIVDSDCVAVSNINRQLMATTKTVGRTKVEAMRERLLDINPDANITTIQKIYCDEDNDSFHLDQYDYIIDCIDSLKDKIALLINATAAPQAKVFSSMGAALKLDPTRIQVAEFWKVKGCPLGAAMRNRMRKNHWQLGKKVMCVFSEERLENIETHLTDDAPNTFNKAVTNGSLCQITAIYGFTLAGLVIKDVWETK